MPPRQRKKAILRTPSPPPPPPAPPPPAPAPAPAPEPEPEPAHPNTIISKSPTYGPPESPTYGPPKSPTYGPPKSPTTKYNAWDEFGADPNSQYDPNNPAIMVDYLHQLVAAASAVPAAVPSTAPPPPPTTTSHFSTYTPYMHESDTRRPSSVTQKKPYDRPPQSADGSRNQDYNRSRSYEYQPDYHHPPSQQPYDYQQDYPQPSQKPERHRHHQDSRDYHPQRQQQDRGRHQDYQQQTERGKHRRTNGPSACDLLVWIPTHVWNQHGYHPPLKMGTETTDYFDKYFANKRPR